MKRFFLIAAAVAGLVVFAADKPAEARWGRGYGHYHGWHGGGYRHHHHYRPYYGGYRHHYYPRYRSYGHYYRPYYGGYRHYGGYRGSSFGIQTPNFGFYYYR